MDKQKKFIRQDFNVVWDRIEAGDNIAFLRFGDGERSIICRKKVKAIEGWEHPEQETSLSTRLEATLHLDADNVYYGISCPCCDVEAYYWYSSRISSSMKTFANLFVNANYEVFSEKFRHLKRDAVFIGNHRGSGKKIGNLNILKHYSVSDDCVSFCQDGLDTLIEDIKQDFGKRKDLLYVISAGPLSEIIIADLFQHNPDNCYIDFGSSIDTYIHESQTRSYQNPQSDYARNSCWMFNEDQTSLNVSVVLSMYKRPQYLIEQLNALAEQSLLPDEILLFQDKAEDMPDISVPEEVASRVTRIEKADRNVGVWGRFDFSRSARNELVCIFDDDTIPGSRWLENCHFHMQKNEGIYGTIGVVCIEASQYPSKILRFGWDSANEDTQRVDFIGHSWFIKKQWLEHMFKAPQVVQDLKLCGEDMSLSYMAKKHGAIPSYVPPHPIKKPELFGSVPDKARTYGTDTASLSVCADNIKRYNTAMNLLLKDGWNTILDECPHKRRYVRITQRAAGLLPIKKWRKKMRLSIYSKLFSVT